MSINLSVKNIPEEILVYHIFTKAKSLKTWLNISKTDKQFYHLANMPQVINSLFERNLFSSSIIENKNKFPKLIQLIEKSDSSLTYLNLSGSILTLDELQRIAESHPNIQNLNLSYCQKLTNEPLLGKFQHLKSLNLSDTKITDEFIIGQLPSDLEELNLRACKRLTSKVIQHLPSNLYTLNLSCCFGPNLTSEQVKQFPRNLQFLKLMRCKWLNDETIAHLPPELKSLCLIECEKLTTTALLPRSLLELNLSGCRNLTDKGLINLPPNLKKLDLRGCDKLTNQAIMLLPRSLLELDLGACTNLTDECLINLPPNLKKLSLNYCSKFTKNAIQQLCQKFPDLDLILP